MAGCCSSSEWNQTAYRFNSCSFHRETADETRKREDSNCKRILLLNDAAMWYERRWRCCTPSDVLATEERPEPGAGLRDGQRTQLCNHARSQICHRLQCKQPVLEEEKNNKKLSHSVAPARGILFLPQRFFWTVLCAMITE
jgi:hypothetical protein